MSVGRRRGSLLGTDERIVMDLGSHTCRAGFSGDVEPRVVMNAAAACGTESLWRLDWEADREHPDLVRTLTRLVRRVYQEHLLVDAKTYCVLLSRHPLGLDAVQRSLCDVLLRTMHVPRVSFIDTHVLATIAAGRTHALVVHVGHLETCVMPVYDARPMPHLLTTTPRGGRRLTYALQNLLAQHNAPALCTPDVVEAIQTQALVTAAADDDHADDWTHTTPAGPVHVPGRLRERVCELFWERGDPDEDSVPDCVRRCAARLPIDLRRPLLDSVLLTGGVCCIPGFVQRCAAELGRPVLNGTATHWPPNMLIWMGLSLAGHVGADGTDVYT